MFSQGEEGTSWYIILKGSVNVVINGKVGVSPDESRLCENSDHGIDWSFVISTSPVCCVAQGVVCTLHEGDDFGKLALVNDAPRAASIVLREDNCHFLRVDKEDFNRILRVSSCLPSSDAFIVKKGRCCPLLAKPSNATMFIVYSLSPLRQKPSSL